MFARNSQMIIGLLIVATLAVAGSLLLANNVGPAAIQSQSGGPTPPPPDFTAFAESYCCDSGTPKVMTPSTEQVALWTEVAQTQEARQFALSGPTAIPIGQYLAPSGEWTIYVDATFGYRFEYPANWSVKQDTFDNVVRVYNVAPGLMHPKNVLDPARIKITISTPQEIKGYSSLDAYLSDPTRALPPDMLIHQESQTLNNGYVVVSRGIKSQLGETPTETLSVYIANSNNTIALSAFPLNSKYIEVVDHIVQSLVIP